jgi:hypothetical protein
MREWGIPSFHQPREIDDIHDFEANIIRFDTVLAKLPLRLSI